jgi:hypothetical protein
MKPDMGAIICLWHGGVGEKKITPVLGQEKSSLKERAEQLKAGNFVCDLRSVATG